MRWPWLLVLSLGLSCKGGEKAPPPEIQEPAPAPAPSAAAPTAPTPEPPRVPLGAPPEPAVEKPAIATREQAPSRWPERFGTLHITIPGKADNLEAREKYGDPIDIFVVGEKLGEVVSTTPVVLRNQKPGVAVDVDVKNLKKSVAALKAELRRLKVPRGTRMEELIEGADEPLTVVIWE